MSLNQETSRVSRLTVTTRITGMSVGNQAMQRDDPFVVVAVH